MANYDANLEKYKKMQKKALTPEVEPIRVTFDRVLAVPLMFVMILLAFLLLFTLISGGYTELNEQISSVAVAVCCLAFAWYGYRMKVASKFYRATRRWLKTPGTITVRQLAINSRYTLEDTLKLTREMTRRKYYKNLTISEDKKTITIAKIEETK